MSGPDWWEAAWVWCCKVLAHALPTHNNQVGPQVVRKTITSCTIQNNNENQARETAQFLAVHMRTCQSEKDNNCA